MGTVCFSTDRQIADLVGHELATRLEGTGIDTRVMLWVGDTHWCDLDSGASGPVTEAVRQRIAAMTVLAERAQPAASREALATSLVGDGEPVATLLSEARDAASRQTSRVESGWALGRLQQFHADGVRLTDGDAARFLVAVESVAIRDRLWEDMTCDTVTSHVALWTDMTKRAPDEVRTAPASMLGFASWLSGNGAMAWCALDQVPQGTACFLADLVAAAVQGGVHPREWKAIRSQTHERGSDLFAHRLSSQQSRVRPLHGI